MFFVIFRGDSRLRPTAIRWVGVIGIILLLMVSFLTKAIQLSEADLTKVVLTVIGLLGGAGVHHAATSAAKRRHRHPPANGGQAGSARSPNASGDSEAETEAEPGSG